MFRFQNNTPEVYVNNSRDFQLLCRLLDVLNSSVNFNAAKLLDILNAKQTSDRMLHLLSTRVGFFHRTNISDDILRVILDTFPYVMKYKGSKRGIEEVISAILKAEGHDANVEIMITTSVDKIDGNGKVYQDEVFDINIYTTSKIENEKALLEYLEYVVPIGYTYHLHTYAEKKPLEQVKAGTKDHSNILVNYVSSISQVVSQGRVKYNGNTNDNAFNFRTDIENDSVGNILTSQVLSPLDIIGNNSYATDSIEVNRDTIDYSIPQTLNKHSDEYDTVFPNDSLNKGDSNNE